MPQGKAIAKFDLLLSIAENAEGLIGTWEYNTDLFDARTIKQMIGHFQTLLQGIVANPEQRLSETPLLSQAERRQLLVEWNDTQAEYPQSQGVHQLFEAQVKQTPNAVAVSFEAQQLTYQELNHRANQLAHYLRVQGVKPETLVGVCLERSVDLVVGLLGILKAGGAYVPLDPAYPQDRLAFMLEDAQAPLLLTQQQLLEKLPQPTGQVICLDSDLGKISGESQENPASSSTAENLAYVIYTSGSTGKPKGVQISHGALVNFLTDMGQQLDVTERDIFLAITTLSFDIAGLELFLPLIVGACTVLVSREVSSDGRQLLDRMNKVTPTLMQATPATWRLLLEAGWQGGHPLKILCGGEALSTQLAQQLQQRGTTLLNLYGPTEATIWATICKVDRQNESPAIGRPIANTEIYILDRHLHPVPIGVPGELHIGGAGLARGYLNRPTLTAEKFIPHPFSDIPSARLYKTGDLAYYRPDGDIEYLGRLDHQVKIRGFRIELGEIEAVLSQHPEVAQCVVIPREDEPGDKRLVAYVIPADREAPKSNEFRAFLKQSLPEYMIPAAFMQLESFPLTPNGKINRRVLPKPERADISSTTTYLAPRSQQEEALAQIWRHVLKLEQVGVNDNFFDLGGHSLLALRLFTEIEKAFGQNLPLATLFQAPTIKELAALLDLSSEAPSMPTDCALIPLQPKGVKPPLFMAPPAGATVVNLGKLVRLLKSDQPAYGLEPLGMDGKQFPQTGLKEMATYYVQEIQKLQPQGPYFLVGRCFGGIVVFEMAQQLLAQGQKVALLALLDTGRPPDYSTGVASNSEVLIAPETRKYLGYYLSRIASGHYLHRITDRLQKGKLNVAHIQEKFAGFFKAKVSAVFLSILERAEGGDAKMLFLQKHLFAQFPQLYTLAAHRKARKDYLAKVYPDRIIFFENSQPKGNVKKRWAELTAGGLERHIVPGDHRTMLRNPEYAKVVAEKLNTCLDEAQSGA